MTVSLASCPLICPLLLFIQNVKCKIKNVYVKFKMSNSKCIHTCMSLYIDLILTVSLSICRVANLVATVAQENPVISIAGPYEKLHFWYEIHHFGYEIHQFWPVWAQSGSILTQSEAAQSLPLPCENHDFEMFKNEELCLQNDELCLQNDEFCRSPHRPSSRNPTSTASAHG